VVNFFKKKTKNHFSFYPPSLPFSILSLLFHISFIHPISLPYLFTISPRSFLSFSLISLHPFHPVHSIAVFSLLVATSKSRHHFSFFLSPQVLRNFLCHTPLILPLVSGFCDSLPSFLLVCVFVPFTQLSINPSSFCSQFFHFFTGKPVSLVAFLFLLLLRILSLFSPTFR
jgi:hypothetical protein